MSKENKSKTKIGRIMYFIILIIFIIIAWKLLIKYKENNFNDFVRTEYMPYTSEFSRDKEVKYSDTSSYKITSKTVNDAMFYKTIQVQPNTPYKVTCMVKTQDVKTAKEVSSGGAHISIANTVEKSESITGTNDWQKLEFIFNSKARTSVDVGFRLGGYDDNCTGTVWFSDFTIERGIQPNSTNWNFACFVFQNTDVKIETAGQTKEIKLNMTRRRYIRYETEYE